MRTKLEVAQLLAELVDEGILIKSKMLKSTGKNERVQFDVYTVDYHQLTDEDSRKEEGEAI